MTMGHLPIAVLIPFFILLFVVNPLIRKLKSSWTLSGSEMTLIFVMTFISSLVPGKVMVAYLMGIIATPYYFARPENQWATTFFDYLPDWLLVSSNGNTLVWFYEGMPEGIDNIIWGPWFPPLFWWISLFVVLFFMGACITTIMRRTWVDHERLAFPLVRMAIDLIRHDEETKRTFPNFVYDRMFQVGFGASLILMIWNITTFWGSIPPIPIGSLYHTMLTLMEGALPIKISINIYALCFAFLAPLEITFSLWIFALLGILEGGLLDRVGFQYSGSPVGTNAVVKAQFFGGFVVFVFWHLWTSRKQINNVFRDAIKGGEVSSTEFMSYRFALLGLMGSLVYLIAWLMVSGLSWQVVPIYLLFLFILYLGTARIIAQTGLAFLDLPVNAHHFTILTLGSGNIDPPSLTNLGLGSAYARNWRGLGIGTIAQSDKVMSDLRRDKRGLLGIMLITFLISMLTSILYTIYIGNTTIGAYNFGTRDAFGGINEMYYDDIVRWIRNADQLQPPEFLFMALGGVIMLAITALTHRFPGWPLAPVGFTVAFADITRTLMFTLFTAWLIKMLLLRLGGVTAYHRALPFAWGVLVGYSAGILIGFFVDWIWFPGQGHSLHDWT
tara:strand:+ start:57859 stop:59694 length:1836 start_codon:yes stop_codon:yes gene_type:complete